MSERHVPPDLRPFPRMTQLLTVVRTQPRHGAKIANDSCRTNGTGIPRNRLRSASPRPSRERFDTPPSSARWTTKSPTPSRPLPRRHSASGWNETVTPPKTKLLHAHRRGKARDHAANVQVVFRRRGTCLAFPRRTKPGRTLRLRTEPAGRVENFRSVGPSRRVYSSVETRRRRP